MTPFGWFMLGYAAIAWSIWLVVSVIMLVRDDEDFRPAVATGALIGVLWPLMVLWSPVLIAGHVRRRNEIGGGK